MTLNVVVDFNNIGASGLRLSTIATIYDLARQRIHLNEGLSLRGYDEELEVAGKASFSAKDFAWVLIPNETVFRQTELVLPKFPGLLAAMSHEYFGQLDEFEYPECPRVWCAGELNQSIPQTLDSVGSYIDITRRRRLAEEGAVIFLHDNHFETKARLHCSADGFYWEGEIIGPVQPFKGRPFVIADIDMDWRQPLPTL